MEDDRNEQYELFEDRLKIESLRRISEATDHRPPARDQVAGPRVYNVYPLTSVLLYNGVTVVHFGLGALGLLISYRTWPSAAWVLSGAYLLFALTQMYVLMPLKVCPSCAYRRMDGARCVSALNLVSARFSAPRDDVGVKQVPLGGFEHQGADASADFQHALGHQ